MRCGDSGVGVRALSSPVVGFSTGRELKAAVKLIDYQLDYAEYTRLSEGPHDPLAHPDVVEDLKLTKKRIIQRFKRDRRKARRAAAKQPQSTEGPAKKAKTG